MYIQTELFIDVFMVFEALGVNLLTLIRIYHPYGIPLPIVKFITIQILISFDYIHTHLNLIRTDFKPKNVLLEWPIVTSAYKRHSSPGGKILQNNIEQLLGKSYGKFSPCSSYTSSLSLTLLTNNMNVLNPSPSPTENIYTRKISILHEAEKRKKEEIVFFSI
jgi:hypothetical protein